MINRLRAQKRKAMSIKSEKAKETIDCCHRIVPCYSSEHDEWSDVEDADAIEKVDTIKAVELAESDARERAVRACKLSCPYHRNVTFDNNYRAGNCTVAEFINGEKTCDELFDGKYCKVSEFLKHYDNE